MRIKLESGGQIFGTAEWNTPPAKGDIIGLQSDAGEREQRRVDSVEDDSSDGSKIVHVGAALPFVSYNRR
jgi:hypothetical protein